jgi:hypothetical protein
MAEQARRADWIGQSSITCNEAGVRWETEFDHHYALATLTATVVAESSFAEAVA